ncbi:hypothetical protein AB3331_04865 [Streptococcus sp. H49]|uniref:hypothetical protein n=1 Tax=Streptococcus huangxiaojuni TaxID=3237239 RepID=UPI0034A2F94B
MKKKIFILIGSRNADGNTAKLAKYIVKDLRLYNICSGQFISKRTLAASVVQEFF